VCALPAGRETLRRVVDVETARVAVEVQRVVAVELRAAGAADLEFVGTEPAGNVALFEFVGEPARNRVERISDDTTRVPRRMAIVLAEEWPSVTRSIR